MSPEAASQKPASFPTFSELDWREAVARALKGGSFEKLRTPTRDGITIEPLYPRMSDAVPIASLRGAAPWIVSQRIDHPDILAANTLLLADLEGGASGLDLVFASSPHARGFGLTVQNQDDLDPLLQEVFLDLASIRIDAGAQSIHHGYALFDLAEKRGIAADRVDLTLVYDPIGQAARDGNAFGLLEPQLAASTESFKILTEQSILGTAGMPGRVYSADGRFWHEAGASRVETLAAMLATAVAYWRGLEAAGLALDEAAARIGFTLPIDQNQFSGMAEIRALRHLWARATAASGLSPAIAHIHAETSFRMMSRLDANTNLIRTTIAAFAAGVGGADSITVLPHSSANGLADGFARRIARNTQLILLEEAHLGRVADPAAGSGRVETETRKLAEAAWKLFRDIEREGGIVAALTTGSLQARIRATAEAEAKDVARRKQPLTGVSEFPLLPEPVVSVLDVAPAPSPATTATFPALEGHRLSEPFEHLRDTADSAALKVFLANLGNVADFNVRSSWVANLFAVGGIMALTNDGFAALDDLIAAFKSSGTTAVCIASSDEIYATEAISAVSALKAAGARTVFFAGRPGEGFQEVSLRAAGVDMFLFAGQDVIAVLTDAQARIRTA